MAKKLAKITPDIFQYEELEQRLLFSADFAPGVETGLVESRSIDAEPAETTGDDSAETAVSTEHEAAWEVVFIDPNLNDYERLLEGLSSAAENRTLEIVELDPSLDGIDQISDILSERRDIGAIHILTHGSDAQINLGGSRLTSENLEAFAAPISHWGQALSADADILFYGCDIAASTDGRALLDQISQLTGADVAASDDMTGHADLGGDWELEYANGDIAADIVLPEAERDSYREALAETVLESYVPAFSEIPDSSYEIKSDQPWGQTFSSDSAAATYEVNKIEVVLSRAADASAQTVTLSLRDSFNGSVLGSATITSAELATAEAWYGFDIGSVTLTDNTTYVIQVESDGSGKVYFGVGDPGDYTGGDLLNKDGNAESGKDAAFRLISVTTAPTITSDGGGATADISVPEGSTAVTTVTATDPDGGLLTYNINGGADADRFIIDSATGALYFVSAPDYKNPTDSDGDNVYTVQVIVDSGPADTDEQLINVTVTNVNDAPTLDHSYVTAMTTITEDDTDNPGETVAAILASSGQDIISDADGDPEGIAVISSAAGGGSWEYSLDGGSSWLAVGTVSDSSALLLRSTDMLRYVPDQQEGTYAHLGIRAWDQSAETAGAKVDIGQVGGTTAFSANTETIGIFSTDVNDAPVLSTGSPFDDIAEDDFTNSGMPVADYAGLATDVDSGDANGIAIVSIDNSNGTWQYAVDGSTWLDIDADVGITKALLLAGDETSRFRFVPNADYSGDSGSLSYKAWDQTSGTAGSYADVSVSGGTTAFSLDVNSASLTVSPVNDIPLLTTNEPLSVPEESTRTITSAYLQAGDPDHTADQLVFTLTSLPSGGRVRLNGSSLGLGDTFTQDDINNNLLTYRDSDDGESTSFSFTVSDGIDSSGPYTFAVNRSPINDPPVNIVPDGVSTNENTPLSFSGANQVQISDVDHNGGDMRVQIGISAGGVLSFGEISGLSFSVGDGNEDTGMTFTGSLADINAALLTLTLTPTTGFNDDIDFTITTNDQGNTGTDPGLSGDSGSEQDSDSFVITVVPVNEVPILDLNSTATGSDSDRNFSTTFTEGDSPVAVTAAAADLNDLLENDISHLELQLGNMAQDGTHEQISFGGVTITFGSAAAGTLTFGSTTFSYDYDGDASLAFGNDAGPGVPLSEADTDALIRSISYENTSDNPTAGERTISFAAYDMDGLSSPAALSAISVLAVNDAPVNMLPSNSYTGDNTPITFSAGHGNALQISDADAGSADIEVTLTVTGGTLTLGDTTGLTLTGGANGGASMTWTGSLSDINAAFNAGLTFTPDSDYRGIAQLTLTTDDQGNSGNGGALSADSTLDIHVGAVVVTTTADSSNGDTSSVAALIGDDGGDGISLREAIEAANNTAGDNYLAFSIGSGTQTIALSSALPVITESVTIDGWTQPGYSGTPGIVIDADQQVANAFVLAATADDSTIRGFVLRDFSSDAIVIHAGSDNNTIAGNHIGSFDPDGADLGSTESNQGSGIHIEGADNLIGGTTAAERNLIGGNASGITVAGTSATGNIVIGNYIGTDAAGLIAVGNATDGIVIKDGAQGNTIGGAGENRRNLISGNNNDGIWITGAGTDNNSVQNNWIGLDANGDALGNAYHGVGIENGAAGNLVGGVNAGEGNIICHNAWDGIAVAYGDAAGNALLGNRIYANGGLAIDLDDDGVTQNDADDSDSGSNDLQNYPVLDTASLDASGDLVINGALNSAADSDYRIEFYAGAAGDVERYLGYVNVTTDASGHVSFSTTLNTSVVAGESMTATATQTTDGFSTFGSTSEFAQNIIVNDAPVLTTAPGGGTYYESSSETSCVHIDTTATVTDTDSSDFNTGRLTVTITDNGEADDRLFVYSPTAGVGQVVVAGSDLTYNYGSGAITVASFAGGTGADDPLIVTFNGNADTEAVTAIAQSIAFRSVSEDPSGLQRTVTMVVTDGDGGTSDIGTRVVNVIPANDIPVAGDDSISTAEDTPYSGTLPVATDADGDSLTYSLDTAAANGSVVVNADGTFTYTPNSDFNGSDSFIYQVSDGNGGTATATVTIAVNAVNNAPTVTPIDLGSIDESGSLVIRQADLLAGTSDADGDVLTAVNLTLTGGNGSLIDNSGGSWTFTPTADWNGSVSFTFDVSDGTATTANTAGLTVNAVNDAPIAGDAGISLNEDESYSGSLPVATDVDGDSLTYSLDTAANNGTAVVNVDGTFSYIPNADFNGSDSFIYQVSDGNGGTATATVTIVVNAVNDAPAATPINLGSIAEDHQILISQADLLAGVADVDGDSLTAENLTLTGGSGSLTDNGGNWIFTPPPDWNGSVSFTFDVSDGTTTTANTAGLTVNAVNDAPIAADDGFSGSEDSAITGNVLLNDTDEEGDSLTATLVSGPGNGSLIFNADGSFTYTPNADFNGSDSFSYTADDGIFESNVATVTLTVTPVNDAPLAGDTNISLNEDESYSGSLPVATDVDGDSLTYSLDTDAGNGTATVNSDGGFTYTPDANFNGMDSFVYLVDDGNGGTATATVSITVNSINDSPDAPGYGTIGYEDTQMSGTLPAGTDADGDTLTYSLYSDADNGTVVVNADGTFTYTPDPDFNGWDRFVYQINDGNGGTDTASATINVVAVNDPPVVGAVDFGSISEDGDLIITQADLLANSSDVDGDSLTAENLTLSSGGGILTDNGDGTWTFVPAADWHGSVFFSFNVNDGTTTTNGIASLTVTAANDAPVFLGTNLISNGTFDTDLSDWTVTGTLEWTSGIVRSSVNGSSLSQTISTVPGQTYVVKFDFHDSSTTQAQSLRVDVVGSATLLAEEVTSTVLNNTFTSYAYTFVADSTSTTVTFTDTSTTKSGVRAYLDNAIVAQTTITGTAFSYTENQGALNLFADIVVADIDNTTLDSATIQISGNFVTGEDVLAFTDQNGITGSWDSTTGLLTLTGPAKLTLYQDAIQSITYENTSDNPDGSTRTISLTLNDGSVDSAALTTTMTITPVNDDPVAVDDTVSGNEDTIISGDVLTNDSDADGDTLSVSLVADVSNGSLTLNSDGGFTYTPTTDYNGTDSFVYEVSDGRGETVQASVTITINPVNDAPAIDSSYLFSIDENTTDVGTVVASDVDDDTLTYALIGGPDQSRFDIDSATGALTLTSAPDFEADNFYEVTVQVSDGNGGIATQAIEVSILDVNDETPVVTASQSFSIAENSANGTVVGTVLATDPDASTTFQDWTITAGNESGIFALDGSTGELTVLDGTQLDYETSSSYVLSVTVSDGVQTSVVGTITVDVTDVNESPIAGDTAVTTDEDTTYSSTLPVATDVDGDSLIYSLDTTAGNGTVVVNPDGSFSYTPNADFNGSDSFIYQVSDGNGGTASATVSISVTPGNDAPVVGSVDLGSITEDNSVTITQADLLAGAGDVDGDSLTAEHLTLTNGSGSLTDHGDGTWTLTPTPDWYGSVSFSFVVNDGTTTTGSTASLIVTAVNDTPQISSTAPTTATEDSLYSYTLTSGDVDGDGLTITAAALPGWLTLVDNGDGSATLSGTPTRAEVGEHRVEISVHDGTGQTAQTFSLLVEAEQTADAADGGHESPGEPTADDSTEPDDIVPPSIIPAPSNPAQSEEEADFSPVEDPPPLTGEDVVTVIELEENDWDDDIRLLDPAVGPDQESLPAESAQKNERALIYFDSRLEDELKFANLNISRLGLEPGFPDTDDFSGFDYNDSDFEQLAQKDEFSAFRQELDDAYARTQHSETLSRQIVTATAATFTVGIVTYLLRAGSFLAGMLSTLPLWRGFDPIVVVVADEEKKPSSAEADPEDSEQIFESGGH